MLETIQKWFRNALTIQNSHRFDSKVEVRADDACAHCSSSGMVF